MVYSFDSKVESWFPNVWRNECLSVLMPILSVVIYKQQTEFRYADKKKTHCTTV